MSRAGRLPHWIYRLFNLPHHLVRLGFGRSFGPPILVLTTTGRVSGLPRPTPLQYEVVDGVYHVASMRGAQADWYRNLLADPRVRVGLVDREFPAMAQAIDDPDEVLAFLQVRLARSPRMIGAILRADGLADPGDDAALREYAQGVTVVALHPLPAGED